MRRNVAVFIVVFSAVLLVLGPFADLGADSGTILSIRRASTEIKTLAATPVSVKLAKTEQEFLGKFNDLLVTLSRELDELAARAGKAPQREYTSLIQQAIRRFDLEYLILQKKISKGNRQYTMISNIMKTRHDAAQNAVNNIR